MVKGLCYVYVTWLTVYVKSSGYVHVMPTVGRWEILVPHKIIVILLHFQT